MSVTGSQSLSLRPSAKPLVLALLVSLGMHALLFCVLVVSGVAAKALILLNQRAMLQELQRRQAAKPQPPEAQDTPLLFVETAPTEAPVPAPKDPKYYSSQNSQAANPEPKVETAVPRIDGTQTHVPKAETVVTTKPMPLQPTPPKPAVPTEVKPAPTPAPVSAPKIGDLAMAKPAVKPDESKAVKDNTPVIAPERPRTVAEARQQQGLAGQKMKQDGGVKHDGRVSFDAVGTPFGDYDAAIIAAVQARWFESLRNPGLSFSRTGRVVVEFRLNHDGRVTGARVAASDVDDLTMTYLCKAAIEDNSPFAPWPAEMRRQMAGDSRLVTFTFFYQ